MRWTVSFRRNGRHVGTIVVNANNESDAKNKAFKEFSKTRTGTAMGELDITATKDSKSVYDKAIKTMDSDAKEYRSISGRVKDYVREKEVLKKTESSLKDEIRKSQKLDNDDKNYLLKLMK